MALRHWIWLSSRKVRRDRLWQLCVRFNGAQGVFDAYEKELVNAVELSGDEIRSLYEDRNLEKALKTESECEKKDIFVLPFTHDLYPVNLKSTETPPVLLYAKGDIDCLASDMMFGIVGTRKASPRPLELTHKMAYLLSKAGLTIVSGMAAGIDSAAACGALDAGGKTVAVFGPGVDVCYPSSNRSLMEAIMKNGCVISENSPGTPALPWTFPQRNRIIAGMSVGVLVTAAPEKSGSVITATRAMEQGRDVFVTPGAPDDEEFKGSLALIKDGAEMVTDAEDILISYGLKPVSTDIGYEQAVRARRLQGSHLAPKIREKRGNMDNHVQTKRENSGKAQKKTDITEGMSEIRKRIVEAILEGVDQFDLIAQRTGIDAATLSVELTMLELDGKLNQKPGRHYELTP